MITTERQSNGGLLLIGVTDNSPRQAIMIPKDQLDEVEAAIKAAKEYREVNNRVKAWLEDGRMRETYVRLGQNKWGTYYFRLHAQAEENKWVIEMFDDEANDYYPMKHNKQSVTFDRYDECIDWIATYGYSQLPSYVLENIS